MGSRIGYSKKQEVETASLLRLGNLHSNTSMYSLVKALTVSGGSFPTFSSLTHKPQASRLDMVTNAMPLVPLRGGSVPFSLRSGQTCSLPAPSLCSLHFLPSPFSLGHGLFSGWPSDVRGGLTLKNPGSGPQSSLLFAEVFRVVFVMPQQASC